MQTRVFTSERIRRADYDAATQQLDLHWDDKTVPAEIFRRLYSASNPTAYWEDRIAEEYPKGMPMAKDHTDSATDAAQQLRDLFGGGR